jgi:hypothetical protein
MGLMIHYKLAVKENISAAAARELVERVARHAQEIGCAEVGEIIQVEPDFPFTSLFVRAGSEEECCFGDVPTTDGWLVSAKPGNGCEGVFLALCQYPREILFRGEMLPTGYTGGWLFQGHCKTQYAAEHGWEHFLRCHKTVVNLLEYCQQIGLRVEVTDEGGYWETRSEEKLRATLEKYDDLVAAVAGVLKDGGQSVESPIFERKNFERLEAKGQQEFKAQLSQLAASKVSWISHET